MTGQLPESMSPSGPTQLSRRLMDIVALVPPCPRVLDIGSDHGHVTSWLLENGVAQTAVATDIHADPAEITRRYLRRQGTIDRATVIHTDGLHGITLAEGDVVILSGLGGLEMIRILSEALDGHGGAFSAKIRFILQPQRSAEELRIFLNRSGFVFEKEKISIDRDKYYCILALAWNGSTPAEFSLGERVLGPCILRDKPDGFTRYLTHQKNVLKKHMRARPELSEVIHEIDLLLQI